MTFVEYCKSKLEKATPDKACRVCFGTGIDQHDTDPMGGSMNTPCHYCKSTFNFEEFARSAMPELVRRLEAAISMLKAADTDLDLPLVRMRIKELESPLAEGEDK